MKLVVDFGFAMKPLNQQGIGLGFDLIGLDWIGLLYLVMVLID